MASSRSSGRSPFLAYSSTAAPTHGHSSFPKYTPAATDHYGLEDDPEYLVMRAALGLFFSWVDLMDTLSDEMRLSRSAYLMLLEDARSKIISQSLRNREIFSNADRHLVDSGPPVDC
ncbi:hypothetical protein LIER_03852 [Lithospermum erythrorhizon]|uniref:Uncharacterized protein n=1 Tax=Lithospermum erythrorhizon TaxID=34254 RepID=A0AAV3NV18_LITER